MAASTLVDLVQVSTATTGTGTITLGSAVAHFRGSSALTDGATYDYRISDGASDYEIGSGVYTASGTTLTRVPLYSSNADAAVSLSGQATVTITALSASLLAISAPQTGDIKLATTAPTGWLPCEGAVYTKATYPALATLLGSIPGDYTWTARTTTGITAVSLVNYAAGLYVAAGDAAGNVSTSPDGFTWTSRTGNLGANYPSKYAYFNSLHILTAAGGMLSSSPTGVTWTARTANCGSGSIELCAGTSRIVAFLSGTTTISSSPDGTTYTSRTIGAAVIHMAFGNSTFVAAGNSGAVYTSADGDTWTSRTGLETGNYSGLIFFNGYFYAWRYATGVMEMFRSADGITWASWPFSFPTINAQPSFYVGASYVFWTINGVLYRSADMSNWDLQTNTMTPGGLTGGYLPKQGSGLAFVSAGASVYTSPDYDFTTSTQFRVPDMRAQIPQVLQGKAKFYMKAT